FISLAERHDGRRTERQFIGVDVVVRAVIDRDANADDRDADETAFFDCFDEALFARRDEVTRNHAAGNIVDEFEILRRIGRKRLDETRNARELALTTRLL